MDQVLRLDVPGLLGGMPPSEADEDIDLDIDLEPQAGSASLPEHGSLPGAAALEVSQTLSETSNLAATAANQPKFKLSLKSNLKRKCIDLEDRERRREREAKRRQKNPIKAKAAARKTTAAYKDQQQKYRKAKRLARMP